MRCLLNVVVGIGVGLLSLLPASETLAQARRSTSAASGKDIVEIRKIEAAGPNAKVRTPEFRSDAAEVTANPREWARISVQYETNEDWIDELEFRYMVLVKNIKGGVYTMFPATVTYIDIPKGKRHVSTVFLRPNTLERHGNVEWAGVKIYVRGRDIPVAVAQSPEKDLRPWTAKVPTVEGVLLNRAQTPFGLVAIDNYETIKPR